MCNCSASASWAFVVKNFLGSCRALWSCTEPAIWSFNPLGIIEVHYMEKRLVPSYPNFCGSFIMSGSFRRIRRFYTQSGIALLLCNKLPEVKELTCFCCLVSINVLFGLWGTLWKKIILIIIINTSIAHVMLRSAEQTFLHTVRNSVISRNKLKKDKLIIFEV